MTDMQTSTSHVLRRALTAWAAIAIAVVGLHARAHEADAQEAALGSLVDAELAFARSALEQGIRAAFLANFSP